MGSRVTSFVGLFGRESEDDEVSLDGIEIPLIQRDFAQGRLDDRANRIRETFLDAIHDAVTGREQLGLDFIYGEVRAGKLQPLDGQQRLTTLFLLHWYVSSLTGALDGSAAWTDFAYATRPSARRFCERLVEHPLPLNQSPAAWIRDQPWYLYVWRHDPTVQSMLVMLEAIHRRFRGDDLEAAWSRLTDPDEPAVWFHLLPIDDMGSAEDLYIKMNSRGKPLTDFETFKAQLLKSLEDSPRVDELSHRLDGPWADVMWHLRGQDHVFDEEFLNYLRFVVELCEWRQGRTGVTGSDLTRAEGVFAGTAPNAQDNLALLFDAFDVWIDEDTRDVVDVQGTFNRFLATGSTEESVRDGRIVVFGDVALNINLFEVACKRGLGLRRSLVLYAVVLHLMHQTDDFSRRLRVIRNLLEASTNEIRVQAMPKLTADVERIVMDDDLGGVQAFNAEQRDDEIRKRAFLDQHPDVTNELLYLEDHDVLRGCLMAFELDADTFEVRARAFGQVFAGANLLPATTGALLAAGDYSRPLAGGKRRFGSPTQVARWRDVLAGDAPSRNALADTRAALGRLLDQVAQSSASPDGLNGLQDEWLGQRDRFEWRDYFVKYSAMREGVSGIYATDGTFGFSLCMLEGTALNGYYRDPYLLAVARLAGAQGEVWGGIEHKPDGPWFTGAASTNRWMTLRASGVQIRCAPEGFVVRYPITDEEVVDAAAMAAHEAPFEAVRAKHGLVAAGSDYLLAVPQFAGTGTRADSADRIELGAALLVDLLAAGL